MRFILPMLLLFVGLGGGVGAGLFLAPMDDDLPELALTDPCGPSVEGDHPDTDTLAQSDLQVEKDYVRLGNQFVVPVVRQERVNSLVVVSLSVEVPTGQEALVFDKEPKLRDAFLRVLFEHANLGGFEGNFTSSENMRPLREALRTAARDSIGPEATDVLILDLVRQDV